MDKTTKKDTYSRILSYVRPQWFRVATVIFFSLVIGVMFSLSFMTILPLLKVMMGEEGFYRSPEERFFQRVALLWRAVRVVLDVGLHTGSVTYDKAVSMLQERVHFPRSLAESEAKRYCVEPAYQLAYAVGRHEIRSLRDQYRQAAGGEHSLRRFHEEVLSYGGLPVSLIRWGLGLDA